MTYIKRTFNYIIPLSNILFLDSRVSAIVLLMIIFISPNIAISGLVCVLFTRFFVKLLNSNKLVGSEFIYNAMLVGMGVGYLFHISIKSVVLMFTASIMCVLCTVICNKCSEIYRLPILSLPFALVSIFVYLAASKYSPYYGILIEHAYSYDISLPLIISGFLKSLGGLFFLPLNIVGLVLLITILYYSRIIFVMAIVGYYFGVLVSSVFVGSFDLALYYVYAFNYILVSVSLCGVFLIASVRSFIVSLLAVATTVIVKGSLAVLLYKYHIPEFTLPFNIVVICFLYVLSLYYFQYINYSIKSTPEKSLLDYWNSYFRFGKDKPQIELPFSGEWSVYQGFDGEWNHKGSHKYAYDFVKIKNGEAYTADKSILENYICYGEAVLSPVGGYVVGCRHDLVDNPIGEVDSVNNWGNYIIIKSDAGFYVEISHLMQYSLNYNVGDRIGIHDVIAKCGNSGYSPEPHIHIQVQYSPSVASITTEFSFDRYMQDSQLKFDSIPSLNSSVNSLITDKGVKFRFKLILDDEFIYNICDNGIDKEQVTFTVKMNDLSEFYLKDCEGNKLYFNQSASEFYFYKYVGDKSYLQDLFKIAPKIPFINTTHVLFIDYLPTNIIKSNIAIKYAGFMSAIFPKYSKNETIYNYSLGTISSEYGSANISTKSKFFDVIENKIHKLTSIDDGN